MSRSTFIGLIAFSAFALVKNVAQVLFLADGNARAARAARADVLYPKDWRH